MLKIFNIFGRNKAQDAPASDAFFEEMSQAEDVEVEENEDEEELGTGGSGDYVPRLSVPAKTNKYYLNSKYGGVNTCILGSPAYCKGSALANCVGYAWGRAYELLGKKPKLSRGNAENWWGYNDGYKRGQTPKLGAIACWRKGKAGVASDGAGHVAVVEQIEGGKEVHSNSGYGSKAFYTTTFTTGKLSHGSYIFQGYIYIGDWDKKPAPTPSAVYYTVVKGDTLSKIARKYGTTVQKLLQLNTDIKDANKIYVGQKIRVK